MTGLENDGVRCFLGIGSNLGDRRKYLRNCVAAIFDVAAISPVYETQPVLASAETTLTEGQAPSTGSGSGSIVHGPYLNLVVELHTRLEVLKVFELCSQLEAAAGRRDKGQCAPRTLDVDLLLYGRDAIDTPNLTVPHSHMWSRNFVMKPLLDIAPELADWFKTMGYVESNLRGDVVKIGAL